MYPRRPRCRQGAGLIKMITTGMLLAGGCASGEFGRQFREAASGNLKIGVQAILTGVVDGAFAVLEPDTGSADTTARNDSTGA